MIAALLIAFNLLQFWRDTNSHAANAKGVDAFSKQKYPQAVTAFSRQKPSPQAAFNLGTAQIAAGNREQGSQTLSKAIDDPKLRGNAFFNRGSSALESKAYDYAIRDFTEALKADPADRAAKRNLEIALARKLMEQQQAGRNRGNRQGGSQPQPSPTQASQQPDQKKNDANAEALLRSVQQQEQEELARMHRARPERVHVGW